MTDSNTKPDTLGKRDIQPRMPCSGSSLPHYSSCTVWPGMGGCRVVPSCTWNQDYLLFNSHRFLKKKRITWHIFDVHMTWFLHSNICRFIQCCNLHSYRQLDAFAQRQTNSGLRSLLVVLGTHPAEHTQRRDFIRTNSQQTALDQTTQPTDTSLRARQISRRDQAWWHSHLRLETRYPATGSATQQVLSESSLLLWVALKCHMHAASSGLVVSPNPITAIPFARASGKGLL